MKSVLFLLGIMLVSPALQANDCNYLKAEALAETEFKGYAKLYESSGLVRIENGIRTSAFAESDKATDLYVVIAHDFVWVKDIEGNPSSSTEKRVAVFRISKTNCTIAAASVPELVQNVK